MLGLVTPEHLGAAGGQGWRPEEVRRGEMSWRKVFGESLGFVRALGRAVWAKSKQKG